MIGARARAMALPAATVLIGAAGVGAVWLADPTSDAGFPLPPCPVKWLFGVDCPGCGASRMIYSLLRGDLLDALHYNAVALVFIPLFVWAWGGWVATRWTGRPVRTWENWRWAPVTALVVLGAWSVVRNLPFTPFTALYV